MAENDEAGATQNAIVTLLRQYKPAQSVTYGRDVLSGRFHIQTAQPLPQLNSPFATAYAATDEQNPGDAIYALVYDGRTPVRQKNINVLREFHHPRMVALLDSGIVEISFLSEARYVVILERPPGQPLSQLFAQGSFPISQSEISIRLRPIAEILMAFSKAGISHNRINLDNIYIDGENIILGECVSEPAGFSQDFIFEPVERIQTSPLAKPDFSISADCYAFAVLSLCLLLGTKPVQNVDKARFIEDLLINGSYNTLVVRWDFPDTMQDFFRGLLNDSRRERWNPESINAWFGGRPFSVIAPSTPNESSRGFEYGNVTYYNRRAVANALFSHWPESYSVLSDTKLGRWVETSVHMPDSGDMILRLASSSGGGEQARYEKHNSELLARTMILLDPSGPIRLRQLAVTLDGIGTLLTHAFVSGQQEELQEVAHVLESDLAGFWVEQQISKTDYSNVIWKLQRIRNYMRMPGIGFGVERCMYEISPSLACQSRMVKRYHVTGLRELLIALDMLAQGRTANDECIDRHIAGFIAAKIDITKEIRIGELESLQRLNAHPILVGLKLLVRAQNKIDNLSLPGLSYWMTLRLMPLVDAIHRRSERKRVQKKLMESAPSGQLKDIAGIMFDPTIFVADYSGFMQAAAAYQTNKQQINDFKDTNIIMRHSRIVGRGIAQTIAYGICLATVYYTLKTYMNF